MGEFEGIQGFDRTLDAPLRCDTTVFSPQRQEVLIQEHKGPEFTVRPVVGPTLSCNVEHHVSSGGDLIGALAFEV